MCVYIYIYILFCWVTGLSRKTSAPAKRALRWDSIAGTGNSIVL